MQIDMRKSQTQFENETRISLKNQAAQLRNLEVQMGQMASSSVKGNKAIFLVLRRSTQGGMEKSIAKL